MKTPSKKTVRLVVTAGPTLEPLDPVRFISNFSTGAAGYKIAAEAVKRGFKVNLISGPVYITPPAGAEVTHVTTAVEMNKKVAETIGNADCVIMAAAVCDFRPQRFKKQKIKKNKKITIKLIETPDILRGLRKKKGLIKVGFALETEKEAVNAKKKLEEKGLDMVVANAVGRGNDPFGEGKKTYTIIGRDKSVCILKGITKDKCAVVILDKVEDLLGKRESERQSRI